MNRQQAKLKKRSLIVLYARCVLAIALLLALVWLQIIWLDDNLTEATSTLLTVLIIVGALWFYTIKLCWQYSWQDKVIDVYLSENLFTKGKLKVVVDSVLVEQVSFWKQKEVSIYKKFENGDTPWELLVTLQADYKEHKLECFVEVVELKSISSSSKKGDVTILGDGENPRDI